MYPILLKPNIQLAKFYRSSKSLGLQIYRTYTDKADDIELPPEPTTCCMSGCANCVWLDYAETLAKLLNGNSAKAREIVLKKIQDPNLRVFLSIELRIMENKLKDLQKCPNKSKNGQCEV